jgi:poly-gamma-glutamate synthesis protein (capsule biosynthesis protein)
MLSKADFSIANMEFTLGGKPYTGYPSFSAPDPYPHYIAGCGVNVFLAANNHILDKGLPGIKRTMGIYSDMEKSGKARFTGISSDSSDYVERTPLMLSYHGIKVGIINFTYGTNQSISSKYPKVNKTDKKEISKAILSAKRQGADCIIAMPHWGTEYELVHSKAQEELAKWLACEGADIIIGSHPHVVQDTSSVRIRGRIVPIIYSMGNAVSNMSAPDTRLELAVKVEITKDGKGEKAILRPKLVFLWCTLPGKICDSYATIFVKENMGSYGKWKDKSDYGNMVATYKRVKKITGIED